MSSNLLEHDSLFRVPKNPPFALILCQINPEHALSCYFFIIHFHVILLHKSLVQQTSPFARISPPIYFLYAYLSSPLHATYTAHLILLDIFTLIMIIIIMVSGTNHEAAHYAVFSSFSSLPPSEAPIFCKSSTALTPSIYVRPLR